MGNQYYIMFNRWSQNVLVIVPYNEYFHLLITTKNVLQGHKIEFKSLDWKIVSLYRQYSNNVDDQQYKSLWSDSTQM